MQVAPGDPVDQAWWETWAQTQTEWDLWTQMQGQVAWAGPTGLGLGGMWVTGLGSYRPGLLQAWALGALQAQNKHFKSFFFLTGVLRTGSSQSADMGWETVLDWDLVPADTGEKLALAAVRSNNNESPTASWKRVLAKQKLLAPQHLHIALPMMRDEADSILWQHHLQTDRIVQPLMSVSVWHQGWAVGR